MNSPEHYNFVIKTALDRQYARALRHGSLNELN